MTTPNCIDVAGTGFTVLDRVYDADRLTFEALGGSCGNVLVSLAMLSRSVAPVLALGADDVGQRLVAEFKTAGACTNYIFRSESLLSPIIAQHLDVSSGQHSFSFYCPETQRELPRYTSIGEEDVEQARHLLHSCSVFYADRLTPAILNAMQTADRSGALVYFEPSRVEDEPLFDEALRATSILKYSSDRLGSWVKDRDLKRGAVLIATHGADGLEVSQNGTSLWCHSVPAAVVRDTCGSGDMVSVGLIDWILSRRERAEDVRLLSSLIVGIAAGQRLAAANCAFAGARGLFQYHGPQFARQVLDNEALADTIGEVDMFEFEPARR